jgi:hypothetical protein
MKPKRHQEKMMKRKIEFAWKIIKSLLDFGKMKLIKKILLKK